MFLELVPTNEDRAFHKMDDEIFHEQWMPKQKISFGTNEKNLT